MATYYVKNGGNNSADGLSDANAWATISKVNSATFAVGDTISFKCGNTWRETLTVPRSGSVGNWITFNSYSTGAKPKILGSNISTWSTTAYTNIWVCDATVVDPATTGMGSDLFFDNSGTITQGLHKTYTSNFSNLTAEYHWTYNGSKVYVYAASDPDTRYTSVEIPQRTYGINNNGKQYIIIDGKEIQFFCSWGILGVTGSATNLSYLTIRNCDISWSGLITPNTTNDRDNYGIHAAYSYMTIQNCVIHDMGRRSISIYNYGSGYTTTNILVEGCTLYKGYHTTGIDISCGSGGAGSSDFNGVIFRNNTISDISNAYNYGSELINAESYYTVGVNINNLEVYNNVLMYPQNSGVHLYGVHGALIYNNTFVGHNTNATDNVAQVKMTGADCTGVVIKNNIFYSLHTSTSSALCSIFTSSAITTANITADYNIYYRTATNRSLIDIRGETAVYHYNDLATIRSVLGWEAHGQCIDPSFVSASDFHLAAGSPAISAGVNVSLTTDHDGVNWNNPPSVGAYEYASINSLTVQDATITTSSDAIVLLRNFVLANQDALITTLSDNIALTQAHTLVVQDARCVTSAESPILQPTISQALLYVKRSGKWVLIAAFGDPDSVDWNTISNPPVRTITSSSTEQTTDYTIICDSATAINVYLLPATGSRRIRNISNVGAGLVTVIPSADPSDPSSSDLIDGETTQTVSQWDSMAILDYTLNSWKII